MQGDRRPDPSSLRREVRRVQTPAGPKPVNTTDALAYVADQAAEIAWNAKLRHWLKKCMGIIESGGMDYSLSRPSKRSYSRGFPRPGLVQYQP